MRSSPVVYNGIVYITCQYFSWPGLKNRIYAVDASNGALKWEFEMESEGAEYSSPAIYNNVVYVGSDDGHIYALNANTGELKWKYKTGYCVYSSPAVSSDGTVFIGSYDGYIYALDANTGNLKWKYRTGDWIFSSPAIADKKVFVGSKDGKIYCFGVKSTPIPPPVVRPTPRPTPTPIPRVVATPPPVTPTSTPAAAVLPISPKYLYAYAIPIALFLILLPFIFHIRGKKKKAAKTSEKPSPPSPEQKEIETQKVKEERISPPISKSITIERAIYDPCKRDFVERRLPRMKEWINRYDPGAYWFAVSIQNNTDRAIEEWGIELETSSALKVEEVKIEGIDYKIELRETYPEPYKNVYAIGVPKEYGIVIPKGGAQRVYFKLRAEKPKTVYEISGVFKSAIGEVLIRAKEFKYLCDAGVSPEAVKAELKKTFPEKDAARLANAFRIAQEIRSSYCNTDTKASEISKEFDILKMYLSEKEFLDEVEGIQRRINAELREDERLDDKHVEEVKDFCDKFTEMWIAKFLR